MSMTLTGAVELEKALKSLGVRTQRKVVRQSVNAALNPCLKAARRKAPKESGLLEKSLAKKIKTYPEKMIVVGLCGPSTAVSGEYKGEKRVPWRYAHLVENGHIGPDGQFIPGHPFMRPAFDETTSDMLETMADKLGKGIEKEAAKLD
jgi:HK97 gp10 family phage protein